MLPRALVASSTFLKTSPKELASARAALYDYMRPLVPRVAEPGDSVILFSPDAPTVCGSRMLYVTTSPRVTMPGITVCSKKLDAAAWPVNVVFPRRTLAVTIVTYLVSLLYMAFVSAWVYWALLYGVNSMPQLHPSLPAEVFLVLWLSVSIVDFLTSLFLSFVSAVMLLVVLPLGLCLKNYGAVWTAIEITYRFARIGTIFWRWFMLSLPLSSFARYWIGNLCAYAMLLFTGSFGVWESFECQSPEWAIAFVCVASIRLLTDMAHDWYVGSEAADVPRTPFVACWKQFCCDLLVPGIKKAHSMHKKSHSTNH